MSEEPQTVEPTPDADLDRRAEAIFLGALDISADQRDAWVAAHCGSDAALDARVRELLQSNSANADGLLSRSPSDANAEQRPTRIGGFTVQQTLATGGMGAVFDCVQDSTARRSAVKLIRIGFATTRRRMRFQVEAELLAKLNHEGIAQVFDAGIARIDYPEGTHVQRPFIAMEFIDGLNVVAHAAAKSLSVRQRVELMFRIARAAQHAHERGIIHRDFKPANIIVTQAGEPKIVDFGVAKLMTSDEKLTLSGVIMGTPSYMSPEQMAGQHDRVDTRSDVYGLGAVLYELLSHRPPIETPSALTPSAAFAVLHTVPTRLRSRVPNIDRDLDAIVHMALNRDPMKRYDTARELADDLERWLNRRPLVARPPSTIDRLRLHLRRRPKLTIGLTVAAISLLTLGSAATWQAIRATRAERQALANLAEATKQRDEAKNQSNRADQQTKVADAVSNFFETDVIGQADSHVQANAGEQAKPDLTVREALDRAAAHIDENFKDQPAVEFGIRNALGTTYDGIGEYDKALIHYRRACDLAEHLHGRASPEFSLTRSAVGYVLLKSARYEEASELLDQVFSDAERVLGRYHAATVTALCNRANVELGLGKQQQAIDIMRDALDRAAYAHGLEPALVLTVTDNLASTLDRTGQFAQALPLHRQVIEQRTRRLGADHPDTLLSISNLGFSYYLAGEPKKAMEVWEPLLENTRRVLGRDHPEAMSVMGNLAAVYSDIGRVDEAIAMQREAYAMYSKRYRADDPTALLMLGNVGYAQINKGQTIEALATYEKVFELERQAKRAPSAEALMSQTNLAEVCRQSGRIERAVELSEDALAKLRALSGDDNPTTLSAMQIAARANGSNKNTQRTDVLYQELVERSHRQLGETNATHRMYVSEYAHFLDQHGRAEEAQHLRATTRPAPTTNSTTTPSRPFRAG